VHNTPPSRELVERAFLSSEMGVAGRDAEEYFREIVTNVLMNTTHTHSPLMIGHMVCTLFHTSFSFFPSSSSMKFDLEKLFFILFFYFKKISA